MITSAGPFTLELGPETAVYVPRGVGNAYQTLEDETAYSYLVNEHWSQAAKDSYTFVNLADETLAIDWPIPLDRRPSCPPPTGPTRGWPTSRRWRPRPTLVIGAAGQLGRALTAAMPEAVVIGRDRLDLSRPDSVAEFDVAPYGVMINAAAYTKVDAAETAEGRREAWAVNVEGVRALVEAAREHRSILVHISSDYVFDGTAERRIPRKSRSARSGSTARPRPRRTRSCRPCPGTTSCAPAG